MVWAFLFLLTVIAVALVFGRKTAQKFLAVAVRLAIVVAVLIVVAVVLMVIGYEIFS